jgi:hypothetical protein
VPVRAARGRDRHRHSSGVSAGRRAAGTGAGAVPSLRRGRRAAGFGASAGAGAARGRIRRQRRAGRAAGPDGASSWRPPKDVAHPFAFTPDARSCVHVHADTTDDGDQQHVLILSDTADLKEIRRVKSPCKIVSLLISPGCETLAAGGEDDSLRLWNIW